MNISYLNPNRLLDWSYQQLSQCKIGKSALQIGDVTNRYVLRAVGGYALESLLSHRVYKIGLQLLLSTALISDLLLISGTQYWKDKLPALRLGSSILVFLLGYLPVIQKCVDVCNQMTGHRTPLSSHSIAHSLSGKRVSYSLFIVSLTYFLVNGAINTILAKILLEQPTKSSNPTSSKNDESELSKNTLLVRAMRVFNLTCLLSLCLPQGNLRI